MIDFDLGPVLRINRTRHMVNPNPVLDRIGGGKGG
jgi:hypothetical protein